MHDKNLNTLTGRAGEHAVACQLALRGVSVFWPDVDRGVDLLADNGCRIQVKSAHISSSTKMVGHHGIGAYVFPLPKTRRIPITNDRSEIRPRRLLTDACDVVVFWGIEQNRFWVAPAELCVQRQAFVLGRENPPRFVGNLKDLTEMVSLGYSHREIAAKYGVERSKITMLLNDEGFDSQGPSVVSLVRNCENAWENIMDFKTIERAVVETAPQEV